MKVSELTIGGINFGNDDFLNFGAKQYKVTEFDADNIIHRIDQILERGHIANISIKGGRLCVRETNKSGQNAPEQPQKPDRIDGQTSAEKAIERAKKIMERSKYDSVNHPQHYTSGEIECIDAIEAAISTISDPVEAFLTGQVIKYLWRYKLKNGIEDLRKAKWYLDRLIKKEEQNA